MRVSFDISPKKVTRILLKIIAFLLFMGLISLYLRFVLNYESGLGFIQLFNLNSEYNIPAFYSASALWASAGLLWYIYLHEKKYHSGLAIYWKGLCYVFVFLGFDELMSLHEYFAKFAPYIWQHRPWGSEVNDWVLVYPFLLIPFAVFFFRFFWKLPKATRVRFAVAGIMFVGSAAGMEVVAAYLHDMEELPNGADRLSTVIEEGLEMTAIVLFIRALLLYIREYVTNPYIILNFTFDTKAKHIQEVEPHTEGGVTTVVDSSAKSII
jgi:hypothetical protein